MPLLHEAVGSGIRQLPTTLVLGSGMKRTENALHVDIVAETAPDVVHNLDHRPWPFPDNAFREILAFDVIEHLKDTVATMEEIHRVSQPGATIRITVPHFSCANAFTDPTHRHYLGWFSMDYFTGEHNFSFYTQCRFRRVKSMLMFRGGLATRLVAKLANRYPAKYEQRWAWMFPAWYLYFELEVIKNRS